LIDDGHSGPRVSGRKNDGTEGEMIAVVLALVSRERHAEAQITAGVSGQSRSIGRA
jgi:hypothetical protein